MSKRGKMAESTRAPGSGTYVGSVLPESSPSSMMKYTNQKQPVAIQSRRHAQVSPKYGTKMEPKLDPVRIEVPTIDKLDPESVFFCFDFKVKIGAGSYQVKLNKNSVNYANIARVAVADGTAYDATTDTTVAMPIIDGGSRAVTVVIDAHQENPPLPLCVFDTSYYGKENNPPVNIYTNPATNVLASDVAIAADRLAYVNSLFANRTLFSPIGAGTYLVPCNGIQKIFSRIRLVSGSTVIEDIQRYNYLWAILCKSTANKAWRDTIGFITEGLRNEEDWNHFIAASVHSSFGIYNGGAEITSASIYSSVGKRYAVRPHLGMLNCQKLWPTDIMGQFTFEFYLEEAANCLISSSFRTRTAQTIASGTYMTNIEANNHTRYCHTGIEANNLSTYFQTCFPNGTYELSNFRMHMDYLVPVESYSDSLLNLVQDTGIEIAYDTYMSYERQTSTMSGPLRINIQERSLSIKGVYVAAVTSDNINNIRCEMANFTSLNCESYQWKIGSEVIPAQSIIGDQNGTGYGGVETYMEKLRGFNQYNNLLASGLDNNFTFFQKSPTLDSGGYLYTEDTPETYYRRQGYGKSSSFIFSLQLEKMITYLSGFNSLHANSDIELEIRLPYTQTASHIAGYFYSLPSGGFIGSTTTALHLQNTLSLCGLIGDENGTKGELIRNPDPTYVNLFCFVHIDAILSIEDVTSVSVKR